VHEHDGPVFKRYAALVIGSVITINLVFIGVFSTVSLIGMV